MQNIILVIIISIIGPLLDAVWFYFAGSMYKSEIGSLMPINEAGSVDFNAYAGYAVYLLLACGLVFFVLPKAGNISQAILWGALFGFIVYGVYDMTNLTILKDWNIKVSIYDMLWGTFATGLLSSIAFAIKNKFF